MINKLINMVKEKSSNSRIFDKDGYRKVSIKNCKNIIWKGEKKVPKKIKDCEKV